MKLLSKGFVKGGEGYVKVVPEEGEPEGRGRKAGGGVLA